MYSDAKCWRFNTTHQLSCSKYWNCHGMQEFHHIKHKMMIQYTSGWYRTWFYPSTIFLKNLSTLRCLPWPISVTQPIYKLYRLISAHVVFLQAASSYYNSYRLICRLCYHILTYNILFTTDILWFSSYIILFQAAASSYSHSIHHPINNSYHPIYNWYHNLFANIIPPYLHLYHAILIICPIISP